jgi:hypothetical protein
MDLNNGGAAAGAGAEAGAGAGGGSGGGGAGGGASAADMLGVAAAAGAAAGADAGADAGAGAGDAGAGGGAIDAAWLEQFAGESADGKPSMRDWIQSTGVKDVATLARIARDNQAALRDSGRVKVPGEGATATELADFRKAIGVPETVDGYKMPEIMGEDGKLIQLNGDRLQMIAASAHKHGAPAGVLEGILQDLAQADVLEMQSRAGEIQAEADAVVKSWGNEAAANTAAVQRALDALGFTSEEALIIRAGIGPKSALEKFVKLGKGISEDAMISGGGQRGGFGMDGAAAKATLDQRQKDPQWSSKAMVPGSAENIEFERLTDAIAAAAERKAREEA